MPRNKETVNALGKSWNIVDIDNLEKAVDLLNKLNNVLDNFADSSSNAVDEWLNKTQDIEKSLKDMNIQLKKKSGVIDKSITKEYEKEAQQALQALNVLRQQNKELEKADKIQKQSIRDRQKERAEERKNTFGSYGLKNIGSYLVNKKVNSLDYKDKQARIRENIINKEAKAIQEKLAKKGHILSDEDAKKIAGRRLDEGRLQDKDAKDEKKEEEKATKKLGLAGDVLNEAGKLLSNVANRFIELFFQGAKKQADTYNNTYDNVAARLNINRNTYYNQWTNANRNIKSAGLMDNIGTSAVMEQWDTLSKTGMSESQVFETALDTVVTQKIVPYLDTTSTEFSLINNRLDNRFVKDIRGINVLNKEIAGNNYATQDMLNTIINEVQPISDKALEDLAQGSAEVTAFVNSLVEQGVSKDVAESYGKELFQMMNYSDKMLQDGSVAQKMHVINNIAQGVDYEDLTQWNDAMGVMVDADMMLMGNARGYGSAREGLTTNVVGSALGINPANRRAMYQLKEKGITGAGLAKQTDLTASKMKEFSEQETQNLSDGIYNTEKEMQELTMENISTEMAQIQAKMGAVGDLIVDAIKGIGTILITKIFTDGISNIAGMIGGAGGGGLKAAGGLFKTIGTALGATGPLGLALAGVGAGVAGLAIIGNHVANSIAKGADNSNDEEGIDKAGEWAAKMGLIPNTKGAKRAYGINEQQQANTSFGEKLLNIVTGGAITGLTGEGFMTRGGLHGAATDFSGIVRRSQGDKRQKLYNQVDLMNTEAKEEHLGKDYVSKLKWGNDEAAAALEDYRKNHLDTQYNNALLWMLSLYLESSGGSKHNKAAIAAALEIAAKYQGVGDQPSVMTPIQTYLGMPNYTSDNAAMTDFLHTAGITTYDQLMEIYKFLSANGVEVMAGDGFNNIGWPDQPHQKESLKKNYNLLRKGLNRVPYDNYPALLHEDEAVLTASTANELRTLVSEYRDTKQQAYNFETIIQDQTITLCSKIDELIRVVNGNNGTFTTQTDINTKDSMKKMKSIFSLI